MMNPHLGDYFKSSSNNVFDLEYILKNYDNIVAFSTNSDHREDFSVLESSVVLWCLLSLRLKSHVPNGLL